jgi:hypothetical protein
MVLIILPCGTHTCQNWDETNVGLRDLYDHENGSGHGKVTH